MGALRTYFDSRTNAPARRLVDREAQLVAAELLLQSRAQRALGVEEAIGRYQPADALVRAEVVEVADPEAETPAGVFEILGPSPVPEFVADRLPESLALPQLCAPPDYVHLDGRISPKPLASKQLLLSSAGSRCA